MLDKLFAEQVNIRSVPTGSVVVYTYEGGTNLGMIAEHPGARSRFVVAFERGADASQMRDHICGTISIDLFFSSRCSVVDGAYIKIDAHDALFRRSDDEPPVGELWQCLNDRWLVTLHYGEKRLAFLNVENGQLAYVVPTTPISLYHHWQVIRPLERGVEVLAEIRL